jgi:glycosyltransferase involved in cell wall biosynthesis
MNELGSTISRPLRVALACLESGSEDPAGDLYRMMDEERVEARTLYVPGGDGADDVTSPSTYVSLVGAAARVTGELRRLRPDIVVAVGVEAATVALPAALLAGARFALYADQESLATRRGRLLAAVADAILPAHAAPAGSAPAPDASGALAAAAARPGAGLTAGPPVSVITTVLQERKAIDALLEIVVKQLREDDEFLVVDGGSSDGTPERVDEWTLQDPRVRLISAPETNISTGRNIAIASAEHGVIACTDAGCAPVPGWLDALRAPFAEPDSLRPSLVAGVYRVRAKTPMERAQAAACHPDPDDARRPTALARAYGRWLGRVSTPSMPLGRSLAVTVEAWQALGGFPETLYAAEDVTFGRAIAESGRRCVLSVDAEVGWLPRPSLAATGRMYFSYGFWDGRSGDAGLVGHDLVRALTYLIAPYLLWRGPAASRAAVIAAAAVYLSLPAARAFRQPGRMAVLARVPVALALMDLGKALGCLRGLADARRPKADQQQPTAVRPREAARHSRKLRDSARRLSTVLRGSTRPRQES